ncbi:MAG: DEAD/DEAH box helicase family protein [Scytolyngbya sp. HA4215-MV1]|jgi:type I restriction enzyme R subunit|nr:DEAD/DEAH box helicase family protein [Scytolyngbya sp. HA4215-MV1]
MGLNEADTRAKLIDPKLHTRGWIEDYIKREETAGSIEIVGGKARKRSRGRLDYTLRIQVGEETQPIAVALIEAKAEGLPPGHGLEQAKGYQLCNRFNVPFVFSTNGHLFVEFDRTTGLTSKPKTLSQFPTPNELRSRYEQYIGFSLESEVAKPLLTPYAAGESVRRYYQDAAIRAALEKIAQCQTRGEPGRVLLTLATGAGKTFIAVNLLKRIADAGQMTRALFVCDRDELRTQASGAFQNVFGSNAAIVSANNPQKNARILIATYQTLDVDTDDGTANFLTKNYPENYFSHIIIDECHRSAWGRWSQVLTRNANAVQIGLTATPRELELTEETQETQADQQITADNIRYFGEPVYEYDIAQGIEDGYLAACEIQRSRVNLDETGITIAQILARNPTDARTGLPVSEADLRELYENTAFENRILLPDRVLAMCQDLFNYLLQTGTPEQKTVIFCVRDSHADAVAIELNNLYVQWCQQQGQKPVTNYAFKCTAESGGKDYLADLKGSNRNFFIATTVDLLSTGVDVPSLRNVVFFKYMRSPITFYQMVGRGTRLDAATEKLMFRLYDYTNATRLFGQSFLTKLSPQNPTELGGDGGEFPDPPIDPPDPPRIITVEGFDVQITSQGRFVLATVDGRAMPVPVEEYEAQLAERLVTIATTPVEFRLCWVVREERRGLLDRLVAGGVSPRVIQLIREMQDYDLYDVLGQLGYGLTPQTRTIRFAEFARQQTEWLKVMPPQTAQTVQAIAQQFVIAGTDGLEDARLFQVPEVVRAGGLNALKLLGKPVDVLQETKLKLFSA